MEKEEEEERTVSLSGGKRRGKRATAAVPMKESPSDETKSESDDGIRSVADDEKSTRSKSSRREPDLTVDF